MHRSTTAVLATLALAAGLGLGSAHAAGPTLYLGAGFADSNLDFGDDDTSLGTVSGKLGVQIGRFLAIEADVGAMSDDSGSILSESVLNYQAVMARLSFTVDRAMFYGLAGQARTELDRDVLFGEGGSTNETQNIFGAGVNLFGNETTAINFEVRYFEGGDLTSAHVGVQHFFGGFR